MLNMFTSKTIDVTKLSGTIYKIKKVDEEIQMFQLLQHQMKDGKTLFYLDIIQVVEELLSVSDFAEGI